MVLARVIATIVAIVIAFMALCVSAAALAFSIWEGRQKRQHARVSLMPILTLDVMSPPEDELRVLVLNAGLGPALLDALSISVDEEIVAAGAAGEVVVDWLEILGKIGLSNRPAFRSRVPHARECIAAGKSLELFRFISTPFDPADTDEIKRLLRAFARVRVRVEYRSAYGERDVLDSPVAVSVPPVTAG